MAPRDRGGSLARRKYIKEPKKQVLIFCEGENTEPGYFEALRRAFPGTIVKIYHAGDPEICVEAAEKKRASMKKSGLWQPGDEVWAVFDRDTHAHFERAVTQAERLGIGIGRSNPCFEVWLILHKEEFHKCCDTDGAERHLERLCPDYDRSRTKTMDFDTLVQDLTRAEEHAEKLLAKRAEESDPHGIPSTTVHHLTRAIRAAAKAWTG